MKFNKQDWYHMGRWVQPTLSCSNWNNWSEDNKRFPFSIDSLNGNIPMMDGHHFIWKDDVAKIKSFLLEHEQDFEVLNIFEKWVDDVSLHAKKEIHQEFDSLGLYIKNLQTLFDHITNPWIFFILVDDILEKRIMHICKEKGYDYGKIANAIRPIKDSAMVKQAKEASQLHQLIIDKKLKPDFKEIEEKDKKLAKDIQDHVKKFECIGVHHFVGAPYSVEKFFSDFPQKVNVEEKQIDVPDDVKWHVRLGCIASFARTDMAETSGYITHVINPKLAEANDELGLEKGEYLWLSFNEIIKGLQEPESFVKPDFEKRKIKVGVYHESKNEIIIADKEVDDILDQLLEIKTVSFPLKGTVASKGKVTGIVKIVIKPEDIHKVKDGDILVAPETTPDFIVAMKKAAGFITDRGGLTSHAGIVSRELGVPCVVGTETATQGLKDGDKVELDAENGIIRKL